MDIELFLKILRETHPDMVEIFTRGGCYRLHLIIKGERWWVKAWYDPIECHVYTEYNDGFYDINGQLLDKEIIERLHPFSEKLKREAPTWHEDFWKKEQKDG